jgi:hypothetical protein
MSHYADENADGIPDLAPEMVGAAQDAKNRALRTFAQGLASDLLVAAVLFLLPVFASDSFDWTATDWKVLVLSFAKTLVVTIISYVARVRGISPSTTTV